MGRTLADDVNCNGTMWLKREGGVAEVLDCLRNTDAKTLSVQQWNSYSGILGFPSAPTIDGEFLKAHPLELLRRGEFDETEIMIGSNRDEGKYKLVLSNLYANEYQQIIEKWCKVYCTVIYFKVDLRTSFKKEGFGTHMNSRNPKNERSKKPYFKSLDGFWFWDPLRGYKSCFKV